MTLQERIDASWEGELDAQAVQDVIAKLDSGELRVAEKIDGEWVVHAWIKKQFFFIFASPAWKHTKSDPMSSMIKSH